MGLFLYNKHFLCAFPSPSDPCCLSSTVHPSPTFSSFLCRFFSQYTFFHALFVDEDFFFFVYYLPFLYVLRDGVWVWYEYFLSSLKDIKNSSLIPLTHTEHFFLFNLYFLMYREKLHSSFVLAFQPPTLPPRSQCSKPKLCVHYPL